MLLVLLLAVSALVLPPGAAGCTTADAELLLSFKASLSNGNKALAGWKNGTDCCAWSGVICGTAGEVQKLNLDDAGLRGTIPAPSGWAMPTTLQELWLSKNQLAGPLPESWALPGGLLDLTLGSNPLQSTLPAGWALPAGLQTLDLSASGLTGSIPEAFALPESLRYLDLSDNALTSTTPQALASAASLQALYLQNNRLVGNPLAALPPQLQYCNLGSNLFSGELPTAWQPPSKLQTVYASNNRFNGSISAGWKLPQSLRWLYLDNNEVGSSIPSGLTIPGSMRRLHLQNNQLTGPIPQSLALPDKMQELLLHANNLTGTLPTWPSLQDTNVTVLPGNPGLCGEVPTAPQFYTSSASGAGQRLTSLPNCLPPSPSPSAPSSPSPPLAPGQQSPAPSTPLPSPPLSPEAGSPQQPPSTAPAAATPGSSKTGVIAGAVAGAVGGTVVLVAAGLWWRVRAKRRTSPPDVEGLGGKPVQELEEPSGGGGGQAEPDSQESQGLKDDPLLDMALKSASEAAAAGLTKGPGGLAEHLRMWVIDFRTLNLVREIGHGSFGKVYVAKWAHTTVAVKVLLSSALYMYSEQAQQQDLTLSSPVLANLQKEAGLMAALRHPNIVAFLGVCITPPCVVTELCSRGSLTDVIRAAKQSPRVADKLTWSRRLRMLHDVAKGMLYLHQHNPVVLHRDLKSPNLLVDDHWTVKISDFNLSKILQDTNYLTSAQVTNPRWLAPEILEGRPATEYSDVWACGVIMWELLVWELPFADEENMWQIAKFLLGGGRLGVPDREKLPGKGSASFEGLDAYQALMHRCWSQTPEERPLFDEIAVSIRELLVLASRQRPGMPDQE